MERTMLGRSGPSLPLRVVLLLYVTGLSVDQQLYGDALAQIFGDATYVVSQRGKQNTRPPFAL
eukprot:10671305-Karenia_brevis.AAC.1